MTLLFTLLRGVAVWCCIIVVEVLHGFARAMFLAPTLGDFRARQVAVFTGSLLILILAMSLIRWIRPADAGEAVYVGFVWLVLTLAFEIAFGRYVVHAPWSRIASDYNLLRGGLLPIGLVVLTASPLIAAKLRHGTPAPTENVAADANAACSGRAASSAVRPSSSRA